jgi:phage I-like protein
MDTLLLALNFQADNESPLPDWLMVIPAGQFFGRDDRSWTNNTPDQVIAYNRSLDRQVVVDFEHATALQAPQGKPAPASGWIPVEDLENRNGEIWAKFNWNKAGREALQSEGYKYISPAFTHDASGNVTGIHHIALTNRHNLYDLPALNNEQATTEEKPMSKIALLLGLAAAASETEQVTAIQTLQQNNVALNSQAATFDPAKFVPVETHNMVVAAKTTAEEKLALNTQKEVEKEAVALIDGGVENGQIAPANRDQYLALCHQEGGMAQVTALLKSAPKVMAAKPDLDNKNPDGKNSKLDADALAMCQQLGLTEKEFLSVQ